MRIVLNEASNLTPIEKMRQWAQGNRKENIGACGDAKLEAYGDLCVALAEGEPQLAGSYLSNARQITYELDRRGLTTTAQVLRGKIRQAELKLKGLEGAETFLEAAFDQGWEVQCKALAKDLADLKAMAEQLQANSLANEIQNNILGLTKGQWTSGHNSLLNDGHIKPEPSGAMATVDGRFKMTPEDYGKHYIYYRYYDVFIKVFAYMALDSIVKKGIYKRNSIDYDRVNYSYLNHTVTVYLDPVQSGNNRTTRWFRIHVPTWEAAMNLGLDALQMQRLDILVATDVTATKAISFTELGSWVKEFRNTQLQ